MFRRFEKLTTIYFPVLDDEKAVDEFDGRMKALCSAYQTLWTGEGYRSPDNEGYDDRGNAVAVLSGLCPEENYSQTIS